MAVASVSAAIPRRLRDFLKKYPPQLYSAKYTGVSLPLTRRDAKLARIAEAEQLKQEQELQQQEAENVVSASIPSQTTPFPSEETPVPTASITNASQSSSTTPSKPPRHPFPPNPFLPFRNPTTGRWAGARIGLRIQADLVKLAKKYHIESLLPPSRKSTEFKEQRILQRGLRVKGTGEGQRVKGHKWERTMEATLETRRKALEQMPALVRDWERRGHGRGGRVILRRKRSDALRWITWGSYCLYQYV